MNTLISNWTALHRIRRFGRNTRGSVLVEVALTLPLLFILFAGGFEIGRYALLQMKVSRAAVTLADLVAQNASSVTVTQVDGFLEAVPHIGSPFVMDSGNTQVIISAVKAQDISGSTVTKVCWQLAKMGDLGKSSSVGVYNAVATLPEDITLSAGDTAIIAEVFYDYVPTVFSGFVDPQILANSAIYRPRLATLEILLPSNTTCS